MTAANLPRLIERQHGSRLVTRVEAAEMLGYSRTSMATVMGRDPQRWPRPAALLRVGRNWAMLWDADELLAAAPPASATVRLGSVATISDSDGLLTCAECGHRFRGLGRHLQSAHGLTGAQYRERHQLPATGALEADGTRQTGLERQRGRLDADPAALDHLRPYQAPAHLAHLRPKAIEANRDTMDRPLVRDHRASGRRYATQVMHARNRDRLVSIAHAAGFASMEEATRATAGLSTRAAAQRIGVGASTVRRWRGTLQAGEEPSHP